MTEISFDLDVTSILEGDEAADFCCERKFPTTCDREAVYRTSWSGNEESGAPCYTHNRTTDLCIPCFDFYTQGGSNGRGLFQCRHCTDVRFKKIVYVEKIRATL